MKSLQLLRESRETERADSEEPVKEHSSKDIESDVCPEDAKVTPHTTVRDVAASEELVCVAL